MMTAPSKTFQEEISKCELCCSNCHRLRTKARGKTWLSPGRPRKVRPRPTLSDVANGRLADAELFGEVNKPIIVSTQDLPSILLG